MSQDRETPTGEMDELLPQHSKLIEGSGITPEVARKRGYRSVTSKKELAELGFSAAQQLVPTLLIPIWGVNGEVAFHQHRPDTPRTKKGKSLKYETLLGSRLILDIPQGARVALGDPVKPLFITGARAKPTLPSPVTSVASR